MMDGLPMWTIYKSPSDTPGLWVVREYRVQAGVMWANREARLASTLEGARQLVPPGLYRMPRAPNDDPAIYETWF